MAKKGRFARPADMCRFEDQYGNLNYHLERSILEEMRLQNLVEKVGFATFRQPRPVTPSNSKGSPCQLQKYDMECLAGLYKMSKIEAERLAGHGVLA